MLSEVGLGVKIELMLGRGSVNGLSLKACSEKALRLDASSFLSEQVNFAIPLHGVLPQMNPVL
jgi:hypothetical protein